MPKLALSDFGEDAIPCERLKEWTSGTGAK
jgi:hypothetical protein